MGLASAAAAQEVTVALPDPSGPLDPHAFLHLPSWHMFTQIYEPLIERDNDGNFRPALARDWRRDPEDPRRWVVELRQGVTFHHGAAFTADDVVFSFERARKGGVSAYMGVIDSVTALDSHKLAIETTRPVAKLGAQIASILIMSRDWAEANDAVDPVVPEWRQNDSALRTRASGTGAYRVVARERGAATKFRRYSDYWGLDRYPLEAETINMRIVNSEYRRFDSLLTGKTDLALTVPLQYAERLKVAEGVQALTGTHNRIIYLGANHAAESLQADSVDANPLQDRRVRQALHRAIDAGAIRDEVMHGQAEPAGTIATPFVPNYPADLAERPGRDLDQAAALLAEAGYPDGFPLTLLCPKDRYYKDRQICQSLARQLEPLGIELSVTSLPWGDYYDALKPGSFDLYLGGWLGWTSLTTFELLYESGGGVNHGGFADADFDAQIDAIRQEPDIEQRGEMIRQLWHRAGEQRVYLPLHYERLLWGARSGLDIPVSPANVPNLKMLELDS